MAISKSDFLKTKYPVMPYCELSRGPSTKHDESVHIENKMTGSLLNFWLDKLSGRVTVSRYVPASDGRRGVVKNVCVYAVAKDFNPDMVCIEYLSC